MATNHFPAFAKIVNSCFQAVASSPQVFVTDVDGDALYAAYLAAFPEGTNPKFKERSEHDCSCCKQFIRRAGMAVSINDKGHVRSVWREAAKTAPAPYNTVAQALHDLVTKAAIKDLYRVGKNEGSFGAQQTHSQEKTEDLKPNAKKDPAKVYTWNHFFTGPVPAQLRVASPDQARGDYRTTTQVFERGLIELTSSAVDTVLSLVKDNALYRGTEFLPALEQFRAAQKAFNACESADDPIAARNQFVWLNAHGPASRFRNTVMGTLVTDLSDGVDIEQAVKSFETKVAPQNYKRTTALITPTMVAKAMETIKELDLEPALERRFAKLTDISVRDVLWVDSSVQPLMKGGLEGVLMKAAASAAPDTTRAEEITLEQFVKTVLPSATGLEALFQGKHLGNLMSLTAPKHPEPKQLFKWGNDFAWSYAGNVADSYLRQQVQALGGRVDGVLRFSHMWNHVGRNASLMDLHVFMPGSSAHRDGCHDSYPSGQRVGWNLRQDRASGGVQDVDYVAQAPEGYVPIENTTFPALGRLKDGEYVFKIHNWNLRPPTTSGFRAEIEFGGQVFQYDHPAPLKHKEWLTLAVATLKNGVFSIEHHHPVGRSSQEKWGLTTENYVKVNAVTLSPNFWGDNSVGNKHTFFVLDGAKNDEPTRGIYNEFLHPRLEQHRKVFEVIGEKTKCQPTDGQLSGLGFSSTKQDSVILRVTSGKKTRLYNVQIGGIVSVTEKEKAHDHQHV